MNKLIRFATVATLMLANSVTATEEVEHPVRVWFDDNRIPYVISDTDLGAMYGDGWIHAMCAGREIMDNWIRARGQTSEYDPSTAESIEWDVLVRTLRTPELVDQVYREIGGSTLESLLDAYVAGFNDALRSAPHLLNLFSEKELQRGAHVEDILSHLLWIGMHAQFKSWMNDMSLETLPLHNSNQFVIGSEKSETGWALHNIDNHIDFLGNPDIQYLLRMVSGSEVQFCGHSAIGNPFYVNGVSLPRPGISTDRSLSVSHTVGPGVTTTLYYVTQLSESTYELDGKEVEYRTKMATVDLYEGGVHQELMRSTIHGPVVKRIGDTAYAMRFSAYESANVIKQIYEMCTARDMDEWFASLDERAWWGTNVMVATNENDPQLRDDQTAYINVYPTPRLNPNLTWTEPVDGGDSSTLWSGLYPVRQKQQDRGQAVYQCNNTGLASIAYNPPMNPADYPDYMVGGAEANEKTWRQARGEELIIHSVDPPLPIVDRELMEEYSRDTKNPQAEVMIDMLPAAWLLVHEDPELNDPHNLLPTIIGILGAWDCHADEDSLEAGVYRLVDRAFEPTHPEIFKYYGEPGSFEEFDYQEAFDAMTILLTAFHYWTQLGGGEFPTYGEIHYITREIPGPDPEAEYYQTWGVDGGHNILRSASAAVLDDHGCMSVNYGQTCQMNVEHTEEGADIFYKFAVDNAREITSPYFSTDCTEKWQENTYSEMYSTRAQVEANCTEFVDLTYIPPAE